MKFIFASIIIYLAILPLFGQSEIENKIISDLLKSKIRQQPNDTIFSKKGHIKKIKTSKKTNIVLITQTQTFLDKTEVATLEYLIDNGLPSLDSVCYTTFCYNNNSSTKIDSIIDYEVNVTYKTDYEINKIFKQGGWENYLKLFGYQSLVRVSRPGLNIENNKAFIYFSVSDDGLAGAGYYLILKKVNGNWTVIESALAWIS